MLVQVIFTTGPIDDKHSFFIFSMLEATIVTRTYQIPYFNVSICDATGDAGTGNVFKLKQGSITIGC